MAANDAFDADAILLETEATRRQSQRLASNARRLRREWRAWNRAWQDAREARERDHRLLVVICAYCRRFRGVDGEWSSIPRQVELRVNGPCAKYISHGLCPECLLQQFARHEDLRAP